MTTRVRFAPSPTGHLHVGNVRTALFNWLYTRKQNGKFILRIEDTDQARSTTESEKIIYEDLKWLGFDWDEGPEKEAGFGPYRQSERSEIYAQYTERLIDEGKAYYCFCSPDELEAERVKAAKENRPPQYSRKCLGLPSDEVKTRLDNGKEASIRFKITEAETVIWYDVVKGKMEIPTDVIGDQIIVRPSGIPRYNYAVVIDDHLMKISHVIRGDDHVPNTPLQLLLYRAFGWKEPKFAHLPMIVGEDHARLSKRHGATSMNQFIERGYLPEAFINYIALLGWSPGNSEEKMSIKQLTEKFSLKRVSSSSAVFDIKKLNWLNAAHIKEKKPDELAPLIRPVLSAKGYLPEDLDSRTTEWIERFAEAVSTSIVTLNDAAVEFERLISFKPEDIQPGSEEAEIMGEEGVKELVETIADEAGKIIPVSNEKYRELMLAVMNKTSIKGKNLFRPFRIAITGRSSGTELDLLIPLLETGSSLNLPKEILSVKTRLEIFLKRFYGN